MTTLDECVRKAISFLPADVRRRFALTPHDVLRGDLQLTVTPVEHLAESRSDGGACDGVSYLQDGVILYAPTPNSQRENFTLAHELGHWLIDRTDEVYNWLGEQDDPLRLLETVCDRIAQLLLLPDDHVSGVISTGSIRAAHVQQLCNSTRASRPTCAIALAQRLPTLGAVAVIDGTGKVEYASVRPDPDRGWPTVYPWPGQQVPEETLHRLTSSTGVSRRLLWVMPWGAQAEVYVDAVQQGHRVIAVLSAVDLWGIDQFHPTLERDFDTRPELSGRCCGTAFTRRGYPCATCEEPYCPRCGQCGCDRAAQRSGTCMRCFLQLRTHLLIDGLCEDCRP